MPSKMGIIKFEGDPNSIKVNNYKFGDKYIRVMSDAILKLPNLSSFNLSGNRITEEGASKLLEQITKNGKFIDVSNNSIGKIGCEHISRCLESRDCWLEELNLENNKLGDINTIAVIQSAYRNSVLRKLNVSKNYLTNNVGSAICTLLQENQELRELYLHWNNIKSSGGARIFQGLKDNLYLKVLDLSWNSMGSSENEDCTKAMVEVFQDNPHLVHLDVSNNNFNLQESKKISEGIKTNQTLYGFHFEGNQGYVDNHGFLVVNEHEINTNLGQNSVSHRINGVKCVYFNRRKTNELMKDQCWICGGWSEKNFQWILNQSGKGTGRPVYLHMDFEEYKARYTGKYKLSTKTFNYKRMVPPGKLMFLFTSGNTQQAASNYSIIGNQEQTIFNVNVMGKHMDLENCQTRNYMNILVNKKVIEEEEYKYLPSILPRTPEKIYIPPADKVAKRVWTFPISIFRDWKKDDEGTLTKCFEQDWSNCRASKLVKNEDDLAKVKARWRKSYRHYKECYRYYAALNPIGDIWALSNFSFMDLVNECNIVDENIMAADIDIKFIATCNNLDFKGNSRNPVKGLVRFELMECLIRIADEKYCKKGAAIYDTHCEAIERLLTDSCDPFFQKFDQQKWREDNYWNEECDDALKCYKPILEAVYKAYSKKKVKPGQKAFMCLEEINDICKNANLYNENFVERDAFLAFNLSMMTQIDELNQDRVFQMSFVEFLECVARISEKYAPQPLTTSEPMSYEQRFALGLHLKIEGMMIIFIKYLVDANMKDQWLKVPRVSLFLEKEKEAENSDDFEE